jgi:hypothetical protein
MIYYDAWILGMLNSQIRIDNNIPDNEGIDCLYILSEIEKEMKK